MPDPENRTETLLCTADPASVRLGDPAGRGRGAARPAGPAEARVLSVPRLGTAAVAVVLVLSPVLDSMIRSSCEINGGSYSRSGLVVPRCRAAFGLPDPAGVCRALASTPAPCSDR